MFHGPRPAADRAHSSRRVDRGAPRRSPGPCGCGAGMWHLPRRCEGSPGPLSARSPPHGPAASRRPRWRGGTCAAADKCTYKYRRDRAALRRDATWGRGRLPVGPAARSAGAHPALEAAGAPGGRGGGAGAGAEPARGPDGGGLVNSFALELLVYPAVYLLWKGRGAQRGPPTGSGRVGPRDGVSARRRRAARDVRRSDAYRTVRGPSGSVRAPGHEGANRWE